MQVGALCVVLPSKGDITKQSRRASFVSNSDIFYKNEGSRVKDGGGWMEVRFPQINISSCWVKMQVPSSALVGLSLGLSL